MCNFLFLSEDKMFISLFLYCLPAIIKCEYYYKYLKSNYHSSWKHKLDSLQKPLHYIIRTRLIDISTKKKKKKCYVPILTIDWKVNQYI